MGCLTNSKGKPIPIPSSEKQRLMVLSYLLPLTKGKEAKERIRNEIAETKTKLLLLN